MRLGEWLSGRLDVIGSICRSFGVLKKALYTKCHLVQYGD
jgi:hypothetical protein